MCSAGGKKHVFPSRECVIPVWTGFKIELLRRNWIAIMAWCNYVTQNHCKHLPSHSQSEVLAPCRCSSCHHTLASGRQIAGAWSVEPCIPPPPCRKRHTQTQNMGLAWTLLCQLNPSPDQDSLLWSWGGSSSWILITQDAAGWCNISWSWGERQGQKEWGCGRRATFQFTVPWPSYKCGGWGFALKRKGQRAQPLHAFLELLSQTLRAKETDAVWTGWYCHMQFSKILPDRISGFLSEQLLNEKQITDFFNLFLFQVTSSRTLLKFSLDSLSSCWNLQRLEQKIVCLTRTLNEDTSTGSGLF